MKVYKCPSAEQMAGLIFRPRISNAGLQNTVSRVFEDVRQNGDSALRSLTEEFDGVLLNELEINQIELVRAGDRIGISLKNAIDQAFSNIKRFHEGQLTKNNPVRTQPGVVCWQENRPIEKVGLYIPGGTAPLISTVLMLGIPAMIAGCKEIILCTPPDKKGGINPAICYAAHLVGATKVVKVGGAQAIAALAQGTETVTRVDKILGPGNQYVTAAKEYSLRYGVAIDMPAGPSEVMVIADSVADPAYVAADLLSQAEHGQDSQVVLVSDDGELVSRSLRELQKQLNALPRKNIAKQSLQNSFAIVTDTLDDAVGFANMYAPEHLILNIKNPRRSLARVINAGSVFLGAYSPESAGDYASGTNHTLPTGGWAKSYSGLSASDFTKRITVQSISKNGLVSLSPAVIKLAEAEGLRGHANAVVVRLNKK